MSVKCPKCGNEIVRENPVCSGCGLKLKMWQMDLLEKPAIKSPKPAGDGKRIRARPSGAGVQKLHSGGRGQTGVTANICSKCGGRLEPGQKFCPECGTPAGGKTPPESVKRAALDSVDGRKYDEAVRVGMEVEEWTHLNNIGLGCLDPLAWSALPIIGIPSLIVGFQYREIWWFVIGGAIVGLVAGAFRMVARGHLARRDTEKAKKALAPVRFFSVITLLLFGVATLDVVYRLAACTDQASRQMEKDIQNVFSSR